MPTEVDRPSEVAGYRIYWGTSSGSYGNQVDVEIPSPDTTGAYVYDLQIPSSPQIFVAVKAYNASTLESNFSNEQKFWAPTGQPGQPQLILP